MRKTLKHYLPLALGWSIALTVHSGADVLKETVDQRLRLREFVVMGYLGISNELSSGAGPYLRTLEGLLNVHSGQQRAMEDQLRHLVKAHPNIMDFADQVLLLQSVPGVSPPVVSAPPAVSSVPSAPLPSLPVDRKVYEGGQLENALRHLGKGMKVTVYLQTGETVEGLFSDYSAGRLWIRTPIVKSYRKEKIRALSSPDL